MNLDLASCRERLVQGLKVLDTVLPEGAEVRLLEFLQLLHRWNQAFNLTAVRDPLEMVSRHLLDSLAVLPHVVGSRLLDVGSGAGLPGIPLAIARPDIAFTLLDGNGKKIRFIRQVVMELGLENVEPLQQRLEEIPASTRFDQITARAFSDLPNLWRLAVPLLSEGGEVLALKGTFDTIEREMGPLAEQHSVTIIPLSVPYLENQQRHLVIYRKPGE